MSDYPKTYDDANRLTSTSWSDDDENVLSSHAYTYDGANRRLRSTLMDGSYWDYAYNAKGEVTGAVKKNASGTPFPGLQYGYSFDATRRLEGALVDFASAEPEGRDEREARASQIGNRVSASVDAAVSGTRNTTYTSNALNQYTSIGTPNAFDVIGSAASSAIVKVNTETADRLGPYFRTEVTVNNSASAVWNGLNLEFTLPGAGLSAGDIVTQRAGHYYVAPATASPTYDEDGNLTSDSRWNYTWDGENRLIAMETTSAALSASVPKRRLEFLYDGQSRRISKKVMDWYAATSAWITKDERRFVYDGWNLVAEVDTSGNLIQSHTWGMDLSGTAQGAGGVGGLLWSNHVANTQVLFAAYDGNGNVVAMISTSDSKVKARYDYNAFGETMLQEGDGTLDSNPYRFSTKYQDEETGLCYYGYRYYAPTTGRWLNRDPIGERGGINLYGMVRNALVNSIDALGLYKIQLQFNAFINGRRGKWLDEPMGGIRVGDLLSPSVVVERQYKTDVRDFGEFSRSIGNARLFSFAEIDSEKIGTSELSVANSAAGETTFRMREKHPEYATWSAGIGAGAAILGYTETPWTEFSATATVNNPKPKVENPDTCTTKITFAPEAKYPFLDVFGTNPSPNINYEVTFTLKKLPRLFVGSPAITINFEGKHDAFPDYEAYVQNQVIYTNYSSYTAPTYSSLGPFSRIQIKPTGLSFFAR